ncbi:unnamed protein product [Boreogadus saida]
MAFGERRVTSVLSVFLVLFYSYCPVEAEISSAFIDLQTGQLTITEGYRDDFVAWANFTDDIEKSGWSYLEVTTSHRYNDSIQAYAAGAVEAAVTSQLMYKHWVNTLMSYCGPKTFDTGYCQRLKAYITTNLEWVMEQIQEEGNTPYWHQANLALLQLKGLEDSYNDEMAFPHGAFSINPFGFLLFQMGGDIEDLESALNRDLLVAHDTWNTYQSMLRIMKKYSFSYSVSPEDSAPYVNAVVALETTIGNSNPDLWKFVRPQGAVMEWLRNIVANRLAASGQQWAQVFSQHNSGTYNNQWMIVDYNQFIPGLPVLKEGVLTVLEQIPGLVMYGDKTHELREKGYWASFNIPYYPEVFNASGCSELVEEFGSWFSLDQSPRAQIFRRDQTAVTDLDSMVRLMRYNNYKEDPLSQCDACSPHANGENAISARSDLNPANGTYPFGALTQRPHGGTDMKVTSYGMSRGLEMLAVNGPTADQVPPFQWSSSPYKDLLHMGHPDTWSFKPVKVTWS